MPSSRCCAIASGVVPVELPRDLSATATCGTKHIVFAKEDVRARVRLFLCPAPGNSGGHILGVLLYAYRDVECA